MKSYYYVVIVIVLSFVLSLNTFKIFSIEETSLFLTVIGLIYGLIAAFTISNAWERFGGIRDAIADETYALNSVYVYCKHLSDGEAFKKIRDAILLYVKEVPNIEWNDYWDSKETHKKFQSILELVAAIKIKTIKDGNLFDQITDDMQEAARARNKQLVLSQTKIPKLQWVLNTFLSLILVVGLLLVSIPNQALAFFITGAMVASVLMILFVIYDLDSMKMAENEVSIAPYTELAVLIKRENIL